MAIDDEWVLDAVNEVQDTPSFHPVRALHHEDFPGAADAAPPERCLVCCSGCRRRGACSNVHARAPPPFLHRASLFVPLSPAAIILPPHPPPRTLQVHMNHSSSRANVRRFYDRKAGRVAFFAITDIREWLHPLQAASAHLRLAGTACWDVTWHG